VRGAACVAGKSQHTNKVHFGFGQVPHEIVVDGQIRLTQGGMRPVRRSHSVHVGLGQLPTVRVVLTCAKLNVRSRTDAAVKAMRLRLI